MSKRKVNACNMTMDAPSTGIVGGNRNASKRQAAQQKTRSMSGGSEMDDVAESPLGSGDENSEEEYQWEEADEIAESLFRDFYQQNNSQPKKKRKKRHDNAAIAAAPAAESPIITPPLQRTMVTAPVAAFDLPVVIPQESAAAAALVGATAMADAVNSCDASEHSSSIPKLAPFPAVGTAATAAPSTNPNTELGAPDFCTALKRLMETRDRTRMTRELVQTPMATATAMAAVAAPTPDVIAESPSTNLLLEQKVCLERLHDSRRRTEWTRHLFQQQECGSIQDPVNAAESRPNGQALSTVPTHTTRINKEQRLLEKMQRRTEASRALMVQNLPHPPAAVVVAARRASLDLLTRAAQTKTTALPKRMPIAERMLRPILPRPTSTRPVEKEQTKQRSNEPMHFPKQQLPPFAQPLRRASLPAQVLKGGRLDVQEMPVADDNIATRILQGEERRLEEMTRRTAATRALVVDQWPTKKLEPKPATTRETFSVKAPLPLLLPPPVCASEKLTEEQYLQREALQHQQMAMARWPGGKPNKELVETTGVMAPPVVCPTEKLTEEQYLLRAEQQRMAQLGLDKARWPVVLPSVGVVPANRETRGTTTSVKATENMETRKTTASVKAPPVLYTTKQLTEKQHLQRAARQRRAIAGRPVVRPIEIPGSKVPLTFTTKNATEKQYLQWAATHQMAYARKRTSAVRPAIAPATGAEEHIDTSARSPLDEHVKMTPVLIQPAQTDVANWETAKTLAASAAKAPNQSEGSKRRLESPPSAMSSSRSTTETFRVGPNMQAASAIAAIRRIEQEQHHVQEAQRRNEASLNMTSQASTTMDAPGSKPVVERVASKVQAGTAAAAAAAEAIRKIEEEQRRLQEVQRRNELSLGKIQNHTATTELGRSGTDRGLPNVPRASATIANIAIRKIEEEQRRLQEVQRRNELSLGKIQNQANCSVVNRAVARKPDPDGILPNGQTTTSTTTTTGSAASAAALRKIVDEQRHVEEAQRLTKLSLSVVAQQRAIDTTKSDMGTERSNIALPLRVEQLAPDARTATATVALREIEEEQRRLQEAQRRNELSLSMVQQPQNAVALAAGTATVATATTTLQPALTKTTTAIREHIQGKNLARLQASRQRTEATRAIFQNPLSASSFSTNAVAVRAKDDVTAPIVQQHVPTDIESKLRMLQELHRSTEARRAILQNPFSTSSSSTSSAASIPEETKDDISATTSTAQQHIPSNIQSKLLMLQQLQRHTELMRRAAANNPSFHPSLP